MKIFGQPLIVGKFYDVRFDAIYSFIGRLETAAPLAQSTMLWFRVALDGGAPLIVALRPRQIVALQTAEPVEPYPHALRRYCAQLTAAARRKS